ncbi:MAG: phage shock protein E [Bacteroidia bacterium]|jgi:phage shock protein E
MTIQELIQQGAKIIDVRTPEEFMGGNVPSSINIPLNEVPERLADFEEMDGPLILCCLSGGRSGQATGFLQAQGIECYNGGGWMDVNYAVSQQS